MVCNTSPRTRPGGAGQASPPAKLFEFLGSFPPADGIERAAMVTQAACNRTSTGHTC
jgi:hypothetical protein